MYLASFTEVKYVWLGSLYSIHIPFPLSSMFSNITKHFFLCCPFFPASFFYILNYYRLLLYNFCYNNKTGAWFFLSKSTVPLSFPTRKSTVHHVNLSLLLQWHSNHNLQCQETASHKRGGLRTSQRHCANFSFHSCLPVSGRALSLRSLWNRDLLINASLMHLQETLSASCREKM